MGIVELIMTVCAASQLSLCEERHLQFAWNGSLRQCTAGAQPYIAQWAGEHPNWVPVRWHCDYPGKQKI
jgi:hypothetical protein